jgi:hypothetical protein
MLGNKEDFAGFARTLKVLLWQQLAAFYNLRIFTHPVATPNRHFP